MEVDAWMQRELDDLICMAERGAGCDRSDRPPSLALGHRPNARLSFRAANRPGIGGAILYSVSCKVVAQGARGLRQFRIATLEWEARGREPSSPREGECTDMQGARSSSSQISEKNRRLLCMFEVFGFEFCVLERVFESGVASCERDGRAPVSDFATASRRASETDALP